MQTTIEQKGPTQVQLNIEVSFEDLKEIKVGTMKRLSREAKIPGFRQGRVPPAVLESRLGKETVRQELLSDALPELYSKALKEQEHIPISQPDLQVTQFEDGKPLVFSATFDVRPDLELPEYKGIEVRQPQRTASESDIDNRLQRLRQRHGTLEPVSRAAQKGDFATIDLFSYRHGELIQGATLSDFVYEVGSARFLPKLDEELLGKKAGDIVQFNAVLPRGFVEQEESEEATLKVIVKEVQTRKLPPLDDEFAKNASEFETLEELKADIDRSISGYRHRDADASIRSFIMQDLIAKTDIPLPKTLVDKETQLRLARLIKDLGGDAVHLEEYMKANQLTREGLIEDYQGAAEVSVAADLLLEAIAKAEEIEVSKEDLHQGIETMAGQLNADVDQLADNIANSGSLAVLAGDILRRKALDFLVDNANIVDEEPVPAESTA